MARTRTWLLVSVAGVLFALLQIAPATASGTFIGSFHHVKVVASTVPGNGDVNPYGTAVVPRSAGKLIKGQVLISNFNNKANLQGTGTTIVEVARNGAVRRFARIDRSMLPGPCPGGIGLTTALVVLRSGWVIVGSLPTTNGMASTAKRGCLLVLNDRGVVKETFSGRRLNGPWDMTALDRGHAATLFVTNVLNGTVAANGAVVHRGTVLRLRLAIAGGGMPSIVSERVIGSGFAERTDPAALVVGPTGVGLAPNGTLFVADTQRSRITAIPMAGSRTSSAGTGNLISSGGALNGPLGLVVAPNGDILTVNAGDGRIVETTPGGHQVVVRFLDRSGSPQGAGALFGLAIKPNRMGVYFVDDATNTLDLMH
jgi:hypothetical protein